MDEVQKVGVTVWEQAKLKGAYAFLRSNMKGVMFHEWHANKLIASYLSKPLPRKMLSFQLIIEDV